MSSPITSSHSTSNTVVPSLEPQPAVVAAAEVTTSEVLGQAPLAEMSLVPSLLAVFHKRNVENAMTSLESTEKINAFSAQVDALEIELTPLAKSLLLQNIPPTARKAFTQLFLDLSNSVNKLSNIWEVSEANNLDLERVHSLKFQLIAVIKQSLAEFPQTIPESGHKKFFKELCSVYDSIEAHDTRMQRGVYRIEKTATNEAIFNLFYIVNALRVFSDCCMPEEVHSNPAFTTAPIQYALSIFFARYGQKWLRNDCCGNFFDKVREIGNLIISDVSKNFHNVNCAILYRHSNNLIFGSTCYQTESLRYNEEMKLWKVSETLGRGADYFCDRKKMLALPFMQECLATERCIILNWGEFGFRNLEDFLLAKKEIYDLIFITEELIATCSFRLHKEEPVLLRDIPSFFLRVHSLLINNFIEERSSDEPIPVLAEYCQDQELFEKIVNSIALGDSVPSLTYPQLENAKKIADFLMNDEISVQIAEQMITCHPNYAQTGNDQKVIMMTRGFVICFLMESWNIEYMQDGALCKINVKVSNKGRFAVSNVSTGFRVPLGEFGSFNALLGQLGLVQG